MPQEFVADRIPRGADVHMINPVLSVSYAGTRFSDDDLPAGELTKKWKYMPTAGVDASIRVAYGQQRSGDRAALKRVAEKLGWPAYAVARRGAELGLSRTKEQPWSPQEEAILFECGHLTRSGVQRRLQSAGYHRTCAAIALKMTRMRVKGNLDGYSANSLSIAFGVDVHKILSWISRGLLEAERRGTDRTPRQGGDSWWITHKAVRQFVLRSPDEIDLWRVEKFWFLDLITEGKICR
jgi:hypothetical protein